MELAPGFTRIVHDGVPGSLSEVPESSLSQWYRGGWRLATADDLPPAEAEPEPVTSAGAAGAETEEES